MCGCRALDRSGVRQMDDQPADVSRVRAVPLVDEALHFEVVRLVAAADVGCCAVRHFGDGFRCAHYRYGSAAPADVRCRCPVLAVGVRYFGDAVLGRVGHPDG